MKHLSRLCLAQSKGSIHSDFLPSLIKDLLCAHSWAGRTLLCWRLESGSCPQGISCSIGRQQLSCLQHPGDHARQWKVQTVFLHLLPFCSPGLILLGNGQGTWAAYCCVEWIFSPLWTCEFLACFMLWFDTLTAIFESWTLSAEEGGIPSAGDRCGCRLRWHTG